MANTDKDLQIATQIAYMDFDKSLIDNNKGATVRELLEQKPNYLSDLQNELANAQDAVQENSCRAKLMSIMKLWKKAPSMEIGLLKISRMIMRTVASMHV